MYGLPARLARKFVIEAVIGTGGEEITTGFKGYGYTPDLPFEIYAWDLIGDASGSIVIDMWYGLVVPLTSSYSICGSSKPTLSSQQSASSRRLSGWKKILVPKTGARLAYNVDSATTVKQVTLCLYCKASRREK